MLEIQEGKHPDYSVWEAFGEREDMGTTITGEDIWRGTATSIPTPAAAGEQMTVVSSDVADISGGTGVRTTKIHYIDAAGAEQVEIVTLNGATPVNTVATNIRFVNDFYTFTVGSNGVAEGNIIIYKLGAVTTIYNLIAIGSNKTMVPNRMVPAGKQLPLHSWHCEEAQGKRIAFRIRSTDMHGTIIPGVFCLKGVAYLNKSTSGTLNLKASIPALSIVKVSGWPDVAAAEGACGWCGVLAPA